MNEEAHEPLEAQHVNVKFEALKFVMDLVKVSLHQFLKYDLIHESSEHVCIVVYWQYGFYYCYQGPEGLLLSHELKHSANYEVHALAVSNRGVSRSECTKNVPQRGEELFCRCHIFHICEGPRQVNLNLIEGRVRIIDALGLEGLIVALVHRIFNMHQRPSGLHP